MAATLPSYPVFDTDDELSSLPQKWEEWVDGLEDLMSALAINDHVRKWSMMKFYGGEKLRKLEKQLQYNKADPYPAANPAGAATEDHYRRLKEAFTAHFAPCVNETFARFQFRAIVQEDSESVDSFITRARSQATRCRFHDDDKDNQIRDQIVYGCRSGKLRRKALAENLALDRLIQVARAEESARANAVEMEKSADVRDDAASSQDVFKVSRNPGKYSNNSAVAGKFKAADENANPPRSGQKCFNCGGPFPHSREKPCPAKGKTCNKCSKLNHFASQCKGGKTAYSAAARVAVDSPDEDLTANLGEVKCVGSVSDKPCLVDIRSDSGLIRFNPDTGADVTLIDKSVYAHLQPRPGLSPAKVKLMPYGARQPLDLSGCYTTSLSYGDATTKEVVYVSRNSNNGISLLSRKASKSLGLITMHFRHTFS